MSFPSCQPLGNLALGLVVPLPKLCDKNISSCPVLLNRWKRSHQPYSARCQASDCTPLSLQYFKWEICLSAKISLSHLHYGPKDHIRTRPYLTCLVGLFCASRQRFFPVNHPVLMLPRSPIALRHCTLS